MTKPARLYPWQIDRTGKPPVDAPAAVKPQIVAQVPRVCVSGPEAATALGVAFATLETWRRAGSGPPSFKAPDGRRRLYPVDLLVRWAADRAAAQADEDEEQDRHGGEQG